MQHTVIDLRVTVSDQFDLHRPDDQRTCDIFDVVVVGCFTDLRVARDDLVRVLAGVRLVAVQGDARDVIRTL